VVRPTWKFAGANRFVMLTGGVLALTNRRLIFLGLRPRDFLSPTDATPTFEERDFRPQA
jgi:hypothetical protein